MTSARDALLDQIRDKAVVHGKVILSSGREADYYVDLRRVTLDAVAAPLVGLAGSTTMVPLGIVTAASTALAAAAYLGLIRRPTTVTVSVR